VERDRGGLAEWLMYGDSERDDRSGCGGNQDCGLTRKEGLVDEGREEVMRESLGGDGYAWRKSNRELGSIGCLLLRAEVDGMGQAKYASVSEDEGVFMAYGASAEE
jgi:hypothetical protein